MRAATATTLAGLGAMGSAMVKRLLAAGHPVTGYNRTRAKAEALALRVLVNTDQAHVYRWLGLAASAFLCATLVWGLFLVGSLRRSPPSCASPATPPPP